MKKTIEFIIDHVDVFMPPEPPLGMFLFPKPKPTYLFKGMPKYSQGETFKQYLEEQKKKGNNPAITFTISWEDEYKSIFHDEICDTCGLRGSEICKDCNEKKEIKVKKTEQKKEN